MDFTSKNIITTAAVTAALLPTSSFLMQESQVAYADSVEYRVITGDDVNFRKGPSTDYASLGKLNKGYKVEYISETNSWSKVKYNGQTGYVYSKYVAQTSTTSNTQVKYVNCTSLNVRSGPGTSYSIIKSISTNTKVEVISTNNGWSRIKEGSTTGYVSSKYLSDSQTSSSTSSNTTSTSTSASKLVSYAKSLLGKPYVWGAQGPSSFDCSGFTYYVFKNCANITLPRTSVDQSTYGITVSKSNLKVGDLVFFDTDGANDGNVSHVGIYIGSNQFIHSSSTKGKVVISDFTNYYNNAFVRAKRVL
nr:C40 family peptidase [uncultured Intestinibacter sp.]